MIHRGWARRYALLLAATLAGAGVARALAPEGTAAAAVQHPRPATVNLVVGTRAVILAEPIDAVSVSGAAAVEAAVVGGRTVVLTPRSAGDATLRVSGSGEQFTISLRVEPPPFSEEPITERPRPMESPVRPPLPRPEPERYVSQPQRKVRHIKRPRLPDALDAGMVSPEPPPRRPPPLDDGETVLEPRRRPGSLQDPGPTRVLGVRFPERNARPPSEENFGPDAQLGPRDDRRSAYEQRTDPAEARESTDGRESADSREPADGVPPQHFPATSANLPQLGGIVQTTRGLVALLDGRPVQVKDTVGVFQVEKILADRVVLRDGDRQIEVQLPSF